MHRTARRTVISALTLAVCATPLYAIPAFPGAEGFGANSTGGRGGDVYHVTTLVDDPDHLVPGSLYYGLYEKNVPAAGRTIVFDVGGTINLGSKTLDIKNISRVTIAGQTAPSPITIVGNTTQITSSSGKETGNIILQYLTLRKGLANSGDSLTIHGSGNNHDIMVDHVSASWSEDEVISTAGATGHATNVTVQYSTMSEALTSGHQYGSLIRMDQDASVSYNHNLYSNNASRNPRPGSYDNTVLNFEFQNNVVYNWSDRAGYSGGSSEGVTENVNMNYVGNYVIAGPSTPAGKRNVLFTRDASNSPINLVAWQSGNKLDTTAGPTRDGIDLGWAAFSNWNGTTSSAYPESGKAAAPFNYPAYATADSADVAYAKVLASVGAFPYARSATDQRLISDVINYTGTAPLTTYNAAEWNAINSAPVVSRPANWDTDRDGMPSAWETLRGFNPSVADNNVVSASGYTRLEKYLHSLTAIATWNLDANGNWSDYLNWRGTRPTDQDATANFPAGTTAPRTVTLDLPATLTDLSFSGNQPYTLAGPGPLTLSAFAGSATVTVPSGSHTITAPLTLNSPTQFDIAGTLTLTSLQASAQPLTKIGTGTLVLNSTTLPTLTISAGAVDLQSNTLTLTSLPLPSLRQYLAASQLTSSLADATHRLGYLITDSGTTIRLTLAGDANADGTLDADDFALLDKGLATGGSTWSQGDFDYDGQVTPADYLLLDTAYLSTHPADPSLLSQRESQFGDAYVSTLLTSVPEPAALISLPLFLASRRRNRRTG